jgi:membrane-bound lytic murein transglycosylase D
VKRYKLEVLQKTHLQYLQRFSTFTFQCSQLCLIWIVWIISPGYLFSYGFQTHPLPQHFQSRNQLEQPTTPNELLEPITLPLEDPWSRNHPLVVSMSGFNEPEVLALVEEYLRPARLRGLFLVYEYSFFYRDHIMRILSDRGLPPELFFIPFIESEFLVTARSRSNALGLWQFVDNSVAPWMSFNQYKDERFSFYLSTLAGIAKLQDNYRVLGDWLLAAAAYNGGLGMMSRAITRTGMRDFWSLARANELPEETQRYVPKLLASAVVIQQLGRMGHIPGWHKSLSWSQIMIPGNTSLIELAERSQVNSRVLLYLNSHLLEQRTPPNERFYPITVPAIWEHRIRQGLRN